MFNFKLFQQKIEHRLTKNMYDLEINVFNSYRKKYKTYVIRNCPIRKRWRTICGTCITFSDKIIINMTDEFEVNDLVYEANNFLTGNGMFSVNFRNFFSNVFRFIPYFTTDAEGNMVYDPSADYKTVFFILYFLIHLLFFSL